MRGLTSFPLDDDIIDRILTSLQDFDSLNSTILVSKSIHAVFETRPKSIIRAVAYNVVGPALPQALRLARRQLISSVASGSPELELKPDEILNEDKDMPSRPIAPQEVRKLEQNAKVVGALEDLFSSRCKDRTTHTTILSSVESLRFQRAMYRFWVFSATFSGLDQTKTEELEDVEQAWQERKAFLGVLCTEELRQLQMIAQFLQEAYGSVPLALDSEGEASLAFGPDMILQCLEEGSTYPFESALEDLGLLGEDVPLLEEYISRPLSWIWAERKLDAPHDYKSIILDVIHGEYDRCCQCDTVCGLELWDESTWPFLGKQISPDTIMILIKGKLSQNNFEVQKLFPILHSRDFSFVGFMQEIYDMRTAAYHKWEKKDAVCRPCIIDLIKCHLHLWCLEQKRKRGEQIPDDCWYGYNCRTQTHKYEHAAKLNHCCEPTRGDE